MAESDALLIWGRVIMRAVALARLQLIAQVIFWVAVTEAEAEAEAEGPWASLRYSFWHC